MNYEHGDMITALNKLSTKDWARVVGTSANEKYVSMKRTSSMASYPYEVSNLCRRLYKLIKC